MSHLTDPWPMPSTELSLRTHHSQGTLLRLEHDTQDEPDCVDFTML